MPEEGNSKVPTNPMEFWEQWYETTSKAWSQSMNGSQEAYPDPFGISQTLMKKSRDCAGADARAINGWIFRDAGSQRSMETVV